MRVQAGPGLDSPGGVWSGVLWPSGWCGSADRAVWQVVELGLMDKHHPVFVAAGNLFGRLCAQIGDEDGFRQAVMGAAGVLAGGGAPAETAGVVSLALARPEGWSGRGVLYRYLAAGVQLQASRGRGLSGQSVSELRAMVESGLEAPEVHLRLWACRLGLLWGETRFGAGRLAEDDRVGLGGEGGDGDEGAMVDVERIWQLLGEIEKEGGRHGELWPIGPDESLDAWTYRELAGLHAVETMARAWPDRGLWGWVDRVAAYHVENTQPDNITGQPWAVAAFARSLEGAMFAEQQLHDAEIYFRNERAGAAGGGVERPGSDERWVVPALLAEVLW